MFCALGNASYRWWAGVDSFRWKERLVLWQCMSFNGVVESTCAHHVSCTLTWKLCNVQEKLRYEEASDAMSPRDESRGREPFLRKIRAFEPVLDDAKQVSFLTTLSYPNICRFRKICSRYTLWFFCLFIEMQFVKRHLFWTESNVIYHNAFSISKISNN